MHDRIDQLSRLFLKEVSFALRKRNVADLGGIFTLTGARLTRDTKDLTVYFSVYGSEKEKSETHDLLERYKPDVKASLRKRLRLKIIPNINFEFDETPEKASRIEEILSRIKNEQSDGSGK